MSFGTFADYHTEMVHGGSCMKNSETKFRSNNILKSHVCIIALNMKFFFVASVDVIFSCCFHYTLCIHVRSNTIELLFFRKAAKSVT